MSLIKKMVEYSARHLPIKTSRKSTPFSPNSRRFYHYISLKSTCGKCANFSITPPGPSIRFSWNRTTRCCSQTAEVWINKPTEEPDLLLALPFIQVA